MRDATEAETLETFLRRQPPRQVPAKARLCVAGLSVGVADGRYLPVIAGILLAFGFVPMLFFPWGLLGESFARKGAVATGRVTGYEETMATEGGKRGKKPQHRVCRVFVTFEDQSGATVETTGYVTGVQSVPGMREGAFDASRRAVKDIHVKVSYAAFYPGWAVFQGGRRSKFSSDAVFVVIFPVFMCFMFALWRFHIGQTRRLMEEGVLTMAEVVDFRVSGSRKNRRRLAELRFDTPGGPRTITRAVHGMVAAEAKKRHERGDRMPLVYLPESPDRLLVIPDLDREI